MVVIKCDKCLPPELCVDSIDDILYSIGLCHQSVRDRPKRSAINNPIVIFIVVFTQIITKIMAFFTENPIILSFLAEFGSPVGMKFVYSTILINLSFIALFSQLVYYYNYKR